MRKWVTVAGIALIALIVAADSYEAWQDYRTTVTENQRVQVALGRALAEQTARMIQAVDVVLSSYANWKTSAEGAHADEATMRDRLRSQISQLPFLHSAVITNANGDLLASTRTDTVGGRSLQRREVFSVPAQVQDNSLYIGKPFVGRRDGSKSFGLSRRINAPSGEFAGVVAARMSYEYLAALYAGVSVTPDTAIRLTREDGTTLAAYPDNDDSATHVLAMNRELLSDPTSDEGSGVVESPGGKRMVVLHQIDRYPMVVEISRSVSDVLHPWIQQEMASAARTVTLAVLAALLLVTLRRALTRHERGETERERLEQELESVHRAEALGFLAASVAHDFNNVLTAIVGYAELAKKGSATGSSAEGNLERLLSSAERARLLVRKVLTFDPNRSVNYEPLLIEPIVSEVLHQVQATLPKSIALKIVGLSKEATIRGDATELHQVVMNLCSNAVHAMPESGILEVRMEEIDVKETRRVALGQLTAGKWICLSIRDTGVGMTAEQIRSVFEPFYTTRQPGQGTGIGMTVVRNIIVRMNGALDVESRRGSGSTMSIYWPRDPLSAAAPHKLYSEGEGETILIVDDEAELVSLAEEVLASLGYEPVGYADSRSALEAFRRDPGRFDAVLTDERMQPLRGLDLAKCVRDVDSSIPILLMTGHHDAEIDARAKLVGISEILDKPLRAEVLQSALERQLTARKARSH